MSGIAGFIHTDGRQARSEAIEAMLQSLRHRGPDGLDSWVNGSVALGHAALHTTPESLQEHQPLEDESGHLVLTFDGRLDNRAELRAAVQARGETLRDSSDAELALKVSICLGDDAPGRMVGDFAFALWDARRRRLFCARDALGQRPFVFGFDGRTFRFASELCGILCDREVPRTPNEDMVAEALAFGVRSRSATLYQGLERLPAAHYLVLEAGRVQIRKYWDIDLEAELRLDTDEAYAERFQEVFTEAVRCRMRSHRPLAAYLSGGLDSSAVVSVAAKLLEQGAGGAPGLATYSMVFPGLACDESEYSRSVVRHWRLNNYALPPAGFEHEYYAEGARRYLDLPDFANEVMADALKALAAEHGSRVLLSGMGGDDWLNGSHFRYADYLSGGQALRLMRQLNSDLRASGVSSALTRLLKFGFYPYVPGSVKALGRKWRGKHLETGLLHPELFARTRHALSDSPPVSRNKSATHVRKSLYDWLWSGELVHPLEVDERASAWSGLELRAPFHDRRLVEFAFSLPDEQRWREGCHKWILRDAMQGILPESVRTRTSKSDFSHLYVDDLRRAGARGFFDRMSTVRIGWVDGGKLASAWQGLRDLRNPDEHACRNLIWPLWMAFAIELWYKIAIEGDVQRDVRTSSCARILTTG